MSENIAVAKGLAHVLHRNAHFRSRDALKLCLHRRMYMVIDFEFISRNTFVLQMVFKSTKQIQIKMLFSA